MMVHPAPMDLVEAKPLAVSHFEVRFAGKSAHASAFPQLGVNAADAMTVSQVGIGLLRQHMPHKCQIHGIVTKGGDAPNIVPEETKGSWYVRAKTVAAIRKEGKCQILTPDECVEYLKAQGSFASISLFPLCGGTPA